MAKETFEQLRDEINRILAKMEKMIVGPLGEEEILQLEDENFRVNSTSWRRITSEKGIVYLENPEKDIWEYVGEVPQDLIGQQLFTWLAAMRETGKVGKLMPTNEEFPQFQKKDFGKIVYAGLRYTDGSFNYSGTYTFFWSSSVSGANAWGRYLNSSHSTVHRYPDDQARGFSVRCLKN